MKINITHPQLLFALFTLVSFTFFQPVSAQDTDDSPEQKAKCQSVAFEHDAGGAFTIPFKSIHVHDVRPDTTKLGYYRGGMTNTLYKMCTPAGEFSNNFRAIVTGAANNASYDLEVFVTKAWISSDVNNNGDNKDRISLSVEVFMKSDKGFHPLYKFDSVTVVAGSSKTAIRALHNLMEASLGKLATVNQEQKLKKVLSEADIDSRYHPSRYAYNKPTKKGVYMTLAEFKNDNPSNADFQVRFNMATDELYAKQSDGTYVLTREAWGFFDGKVLFIKIGDNYFPVDHEGTAMNFFAASDLKKQATTRFDAPPTMISAPAIALDYMMRTKRRKLVKLKPYQLNALTGEVY